MIKGYNFCRCENPRYIRNKYTNELLEVPCNCCRACSLRRRDKMVTLCSQEKEKWTYQLFVTLTYDNDHVPLLQPVRKESRKGYRFYNLCNRFKNLGSYVHFEPDLYHKSEHWINTLLHKVNMPFIPYCNPRDVQLFLKRLRKLLSKYTDEKIRYFAVAEYGPVHFRPHYHLLLFFNETLTNETIGLCIKYAWGYVYRFRRTYQKKVYNKKKKTYVQKTVRKRLRAYRFFGRVHYELSKGSADNYCAQYVNCSVSLPKFYSLLSFLKPFQLHSKNFGFPFSQDFKKEVYKDESYRFVEHVSQRNNKLVTYELQNSFKARFYPRCRGYLSKTFGELYISYTIYSKAREYYQTENISAITNNIVFSYLQNISDYFTNYFKEYFLCQDYQRLDPNTDSCKRLYNKIKNELYLSKHFVMFVCDNNKALYHLRVKQIQSFWNNEQVKKLSNFYETQQEFIAQNPLNLDYLPFMYQNFIEYFANHITDYNIDVYDNVIAENFNTYFNKITNELFNIKGNRIFFNYDFVPNLKMHSFYNILQNDSSKDFNKSIKHKKLNDLNNLLKHI